MGVAPTTILPSRAARRRPGERGTHEAQPRFALSHQTREIRVVPRLMRRFGKASNHSGEKPPSEREALWLSKVCTIQVNNLVSVEYSPIQRHLLDPQRRKSLIVSVPCRMGSARPSRTGRGRTDHPREVIEAALAHVVRNRVEAAYARSDLFERRRVLMEDWAEYLNGHRGIEDIPCT